MALRFVLIPRHNCTQERNKKDRKEKKKMLLCPTPHAAQSFIAMEQEMKAGLAGGLSDASLTTAQLQVVGSQFLRRWLGACITSQHNEL